MFLAVKSFPNLQPETSAYPAPVVSEPPSSTFSPEDVCDLWFSFRLGQPEYQRDIIEEDYINCVNARSTPSPVGVEKIMPETELNGQYLSHFIRRAAGDGTIIETNFSPLNSNYRLINQWFANSDDLHIKVYAGGRQSDTASGDALLNDLSWPGVMVVTSSDKNEKFLPEKSGIFWTPQNLGPVRIIDVSGTTLTLAAKDGSSFNFDVGNLTFLSTQAGPPLSRSIADGVLIESGKNQYQLDGFEFMNQWSYTDKNGNLTTMLAGNEKNVRKNGALLIVVSPADDHSMILEKVAYQTNLEDGALRIVNIENGILTIVSESGLVYQFDSTKRQFITLPSGSLPIFGNSILTGTSDPENETFYEISTPNQAPINVGTRTPLPTYNPYP